MKKSTVLLICLLTTHNLCFSQMYEALFDNTVDKTDISMRRVAIIPNRLPMALAEPEKWRKYNWQLIANEFKMRGYEVIDYQTTLDAVKESNLPLEDTQGNLNSQYFFYQIF